MGFKVEPIQYKLDFAGSEFNGLEVLVKEVNVGNLTDLAQLSDSIEASSGPGKAKAVQEIFAILGASLVQWNLEDANDNPVSADIDGIRSQPLRLIMVIVKAWMSAMADVSGPLPISSRDGETSLELSIPMEPS